MAQLKQWLGSVLISGAVVLAWTSGAEAATVKSDQSQIEDAATTAPNVLVTAKLENSIGTRCAMGDGVPQDYRMAAQWFQKSADHGYGKAEYNLGNQYYFGQGVKQDYTEAATWWERAAKQNIAAAQYNLGNLYYFGHGVKQDFQKAAYWWQEAAAHGVNQASANLLTLHRMEQSEASAAPSKTNVVASSTGAEVKVADTRAVKED